MRWAVGMEYARAVVPVRASMKKKRKKMKKSGVLTRASKLKGGSKRGGQARDSTWISRSGGKEASRAWVHSEIGIPSWDVDAFGPYLKDIIIILRIINLVNLSNESLRRPIIYLIFRRVDKLIMS